MRRGNRVQLAQQLYWSEPAPVDRNWRAAFKTDFDLGRSVGRAFGRNHPLPHGLFRPVGRVLQAPTFVAQVPDIAVAAVDVGGGLLDGNVVRERVSDGVFARAYRSEERRVGKEGR